MTAPEVINYADYTLGTTEESAAPASPQAQSDSRLKRQVTEELFILPQNGRVLHLVDSMGLGRVLPVSLDTVCEMLKLSRAPMWYTPTFGI